jgi:hypothetical protein
MGHWILDQRIDSIHIHSVNNAYNLDFVQEFTGYARALHRQRWAAEDGADGSGRRPFPGGRRSEGDGT